MFLGYQNDKIAFVAETREELENMPCVSFVKIEETDKTYFLHNGKYVCEVPYEQQVEEVRQARANAYANEVDPLMAEYTRKKTFNLFEEGEEEKLLAEIEAKVGVIKTRFPYPVEPIEKIEELPVVEEEVVSKMENVEETNSFDSEEVI